MQDILDDASEEEVDYPSPDTNSTASANHHGFIFSYSSTILTLRALHPPSIAAYWDIYKENVDPLIRILHKPTFEKQILEASRGLDHVSKALEAVMFAIYLAVITSMSTEECRTRLSEDKEAAIKKYRFGAEQALARADFLITQDIVVLQAFTIFLTCVRRYDDTRFVWTLTGLIIRIAQAMGMQRDGQKFGVAPFETEMRRRIWWQITTLDHRASEDHGTDPLIVEQIFDTRLPLNINDRDIYPDMKEYPEEYEGCTEMTFDLIRYEVGNAMRRLTYVPPGPNTCQTWDAQATVEDKERMIESLKQHLEDKYLKHCDASVPLYWVTATVARLIISKMYLIVHRPFRRGDAGAGLPQDTKDRLFLSSVEVIEFSQLLESEQATVKWGWLFRTYVQWHAVAYVLSELSTRTQGADVERAWRVIEGVFEEWDGTVPINKKGMLWKPLRQLMAKARAARAREMERSARFPLDGSLGPVPPLAHPTMQSIPIQDALLDFQGFDSSFPISAETQPGLVSASDGMQPMLPMDPIQSYEGDVNQWVQSDSAIAQDPLIGDENMNWAGWDDMVKDFQLEVQHNQEVQRGPVLGSMASWW
ncbi:hypothetical protein MMC12_000504 [Toensbergia leucococca]|nr:hypothetical protein [Toensbergia leucococca]